MKQFSSLLRKKFFSPLLVSSFAIIAMMIALTITPHTFAALSDNVIGSGWSSSTGWIQFNNCVEADSSDCNPDGVKYGLNVADLPPIGNCDAVAGTDMLRCPATGKVWSSNMGWISFQKAAMDDTDCPNTKAGVKDSSGASIPCSAYAEAKLKTPATATDPAEYEYITEEVEVDVNGAKVKTNVIPVKGWARVCSVLVDCDNAASGGYIDADAANPSNTDGFYRGGFDGYISLHSPDDGASGSAALNPGSLFWGVGIKPDNTLTGFAWGSDVIGWIKFYGKVFLKTVKPTVSIVANPTTIVKYGTGDGTVPEKTTLTVAAVNIGDILNDSSVCELETTPSTTSTPNFVWAIDNATLTTPNNYQGVDATVSPEVTTTYKITCTQKIDTSGVGTTVTTPIKASASVTVTVIDKSVCTGGDVKDTEGKCCAQSVIDANLNGTCTAPKCPNTTDTVYGTGQCCDTRTNSVDTVNDQCCDTATYTTNGGSCIAPSTPNTGTNPSGPSGPTIGTVNACSVYGANLEPDTTGNCCLPDLKVAGRCVCTAAQVVAGECFLTKKKPKFNEF